MCRLKVPFRAPVPFGALAFAAALVVGGLAPLAAPPAGAAAESRAESDLAERVRARFEVDTLRDGLLLRPTTAGTVPWKKSSTCSTSWWPTKAVPTWCNSAAASLPYTRSFLKSWTSPNANPSGT